MKLKVKTKLRNEKDELQVDDVSSLFSTINEGIESGEVEATRLYRHVLNGGDISAQGDPNIVIYATFKTRLSGDASWVGQYLRDNANLVLSVRGPYHGTKYTFARDFGNTTHNGTTVMYLVYSQNDLIYVAGNLTDNVMLVQ